jgi:hypothetical protein
MLTGLALVLSVDQLTIAEAAQPHLWSGCTRRLNFFN